MKPSPTNTGASVRQRLLNLAHERGEEFQFILVYFGLERLLYRLAHSDHVEKFLLKGALLFGVWSGEVSRRPTRDLDLAGLGELGPEQVAEIFRDICRQPGADDGIVFDPESVQTERIREIHRTPGVRVRLMAQLAGARIPLQIDIGFGDTVTPSPSRLKYPALLGHPTPRLKTYPRETMIAEKFECMVLFGMANSRIKDYYDLWVLGRTFDFSGSFLTEAIRATFERRQTPVPIETPLALKAEFYEDRHRQANWKSLSARLSRNEAPQISFAEACSFLEGFLMPPSRNAANGGTFEAEWKAPGPWITG